MARTCAISGQKRQVGNNVSHAKNRTKRVFDVNLQTKSIYVPEEKRSIRIKISTRILRTIDKLGFTATLKKYGLTVADLK